MPTPASATGASAKSPSDGPNGNTGGQAKEPPSSAAGEAQHMHGVSCCRLDLLDGLNAFMEAPVAVFLASERGGGGVVAERDLDSTRIVMRDLKRKHRASTRKMKQRGQKRHLDVESILRPGRRPRSFDSIVQKLSQPISVSGAEWN